MVFTVADKCHPSSFHFALPFSSFHVPFPLPFSILCFHFHFLICASGVAPTAQSTISSFRLPRTCRTTLSQSASVYLYSLETRPPPSVPYAIARAPTIKRVGGKTGLPKTEGEGARPGRFSHVMRALTIITRHAIC